MLAAATAFRKAEAGVANLRAAMDFVTEKVPAIDANRFYTAGHSSAGTLSLLAASKEPRVKGAIAYAPCTDVPKRLAPALPVLSKLMPWIGDFARDTSPLTNVADIKCPVFLFHAADDSNVPIAETTAFLAELKKTNARATFAQVLRGEHYDSMIREGIPKGIEWLQGVSGHAVVARPPVDPMPGPADPMPANTKLTKANLAKIQAGTPRAAALAVLGNPATITPPVRIGTNIRQTVTWREGGALVIITFVNDRVAAVNSAGIK